MERWDSSTYAGASHVRYPRPDRAGDTHDFASAEESGATCWSSHQTSVLDSGSGPEFSPPASPNSPDSQCSVTVIGDDDQCEESAVVQYSLRVMIINPEKKREYVMVKAEKCTREVMDYEMIKKLILDNFPADIPQPQADKMEFGYVEPRHGLKGKKEWFFDDTDVSEFISKFESKKKKEFTLWCFSQSPKGNDKRGTKRTKSKSPTRKSGSSRYDAHVAKMAKVDDIYKKIHDAHGSLFTPEQKRAWAHMIELGKHDSVTQPPDKRFFKSSSTSATIESSPCATVSKSSISSASSSTTTPALITSPGRRVSIRSECIDQLKKWHSLLDCGAITKEQYEEIQGTILSDVRKL